MPSRVKVEGHEGGGPESEFEVEVFGDMVRVD